MPRANRYFLPGHVWHITHRCHQQDFLLKFAFDRTALTHWLFEARKRYGLCEGRSPMGFSLGSVRKPPFFAISASIYAFDCAA